MSEDQRPPDDLEPTRRDSDASSGESEDVARYGGETRSLAPGNRIGDFELVAELGRGGMGVVWKALDTTLEREVAIKFLPDEVAEDPERLSRFQREAKALAALNHPSIVTIYSVAVVGDLRFFTMELVEGTPLSERIPKTGFDLKEILDVAVPLADALDTAHDHGITHRDLKPANVMISETGRVKVLDFGLARLLRQDAVPEGPPLSTESLSLTRQGTVLGTAPYMSPEQIEGKTIDHRSDLFSLGTLLYELATGHRPFTGDSQPALASSILRDEPTSLTEVRSDLPEEFSRIVERCLQKDPELRFQAAAELKAELEKLKLQCDQGAVTAARIKRRNRAAIRLAGLGLALALTIAGTYLGYLQWSPPSTTKLESHKIVVLPFRYLGPPDESYFAAGITEEITGRLGSVNGLTVISSISAARYDGEERNVNRIRRELGVDYILDGTIVWAADTDGSERVRVTPHLIRASDDTHLWSQAYDERIEDVLDVQSSIATRVIHELGVPLSESERQAVTARPTDDPAAYEAYLSGLDRAHAVGDRDDLLVALDMFDRAVALDTDFARAYVEICKVHVNMYNNGIDRTPSRLLRAREAVDRAMEIDPQLPEAHFALGLYHYHGFSDYDRALKHLLIAAGGLPNDSTLQTWIAAVHRRRGNWDEAIAAYERAHELDPQSGLCNWALGITYLFVRRYEEAEPLLKQAIVLAPDVGSFHLWHQLNYLLWDGSTKRARGVIEHAPRQSSTRVILDWVELERLDRNWPALLSRLDETSADVLAEQWRYMPVELYRCMSQLGMGELTRAEEHCEASRKMLEQEIQRSPEDARIQAALAWTYALLGRRVEAIRHAELAVDAKPISVDAIDGAHILAESAKILARVGESRSALDRIEQVLSTPGPSSRALFRLDPDWDPLRENPRFQELVEQDQ
jgi:serine/threonine protein kinase/Flp pilus assembly protein TadD